MTLVNTGKKTICITAGHVFEKYREHKKEFSDLECQVGSVRIDLEDYLVDCCSGLDLATFELSPVLFGRHWSFRAWSAKMATDSLQN